MHPLAWYEDGTKRPMLDHGGEETWIGGEGRRDKACFAIGGGKLGMGDSGRGHVAGTVSAWLGD